MLTDRKMRDRKMKLARGFFGDHGVGGRLSAGCTRLRMMTVEVLRTE